ncbi:MAG: pyridoxamine 5'-phosphate oxidase family protein [Acidobacteria bacterium]|nr:pyridoxamine 5'-phosphate oxidase family protein [Acidobacteriota bacterium]
MSEKNYTGREGLEKLAELIKGIDFTMFTTVDEDGTLHSRPMSTQKVDKLGPFDGTLYFLTRIDSRKVDEIRDDQYVLLNYADTSNAKYIAVQGRATVSRDKAKIHEFWHDAFKAFFSEGEDDPSIALLSVKVEGAEYWEANASRIVRMAKWAVAAVTHGAMDMGDTGKIIT